MGRTVYLPIFTWLAVYTTYIPLIYCLLGGYMLPAATYHLIGEPETTIDWWFFTNPSEKYVFVKMGSSSPGVKIKHIWVATTQLPTWKPYKSTECRQIYQSRGSYGGVCETSAISKQLSGCLASDGFHQFHCSKVLWDLFIPGSSRYVKFLPFGWVFGWKGTNFTHLEDPGIHSMLWWKHIQSCRIFYCRNPSKSCYVIVSNI